MDNNSIWTRKKPSFGFVSTRFAGTDGVTLEAKKWVDVMETNGCKCYYMAGKLDTNPAISHLAPQAFFHHPDIVEIQDALFVRKTRTRTITERVDELKIKLKNELEAFHRKFGFDILVVQNAFAIPVNVPLGLALAEFCAETGIPTIAYNHDFFWERQRFHSFAAMDYLRKAFPPVLPSIRHVVIHSLAGQALGRRTGESWTLVPNVLDFKNLPQGVDEYTRDFRQEVGLKEDDIFILQPTQVVNRKGIESAIELVRRLDMPNAVLVITHEAEDEGVRRRCLLLVHHRRNRGTGQRSTGECRTARGDGREKLHARLALSVVRNARRKARIRPGGHIWHLTNPKKVRGDLCSRVHAVLAQPGCARSRRKWAATQDTLRGPLHFPTSRDRRGVRAASIRRPDLLR